jgi:hypothetical protein
MFASIFFLGILTFNSLNNSSSLDKSSDSLHTVETRRNNETVKHKVLRWRSFVREG